MRDWLGLLAVAAVALLLVVVMAGAGQEEILNTRSQPVPGWVQP